MSKKIGILGSGNVGRMLGDGFLKLGYAVQIGSRTPEKLNDWLSAAKGEASTGSFLETTQNADVIVLASNWGGTKELIESVGAAAFAGKIVIDVTNPLDFSTGTPKFSVTLGNSAGEQIQSWLPEAKVVKAFNIVTATYMCNPVLEEGTADMFIAGNDAEAKAFVTEIALKWGWGSCSDMGDIAMSYWLETMAMFWIYFGVINNHWTHAFKLLKK